MPRIRLDRQQIQPVADSWQQTMVDRLRAGKVVPILGNTVGDNLAMGGHDRLVEAYAHYCDYELVHRALPEIAQFRRVTDRGIADTWALKTDYINFIKNWLFDRAIQDQVLQDVRDEVEAEFDDLHFSEFATRLGYPRFDTDRGHYWLLLASFPLPIYITTGYHDFLEVALRKAGKQPHTEFCRWHKGLESIPSIFDTEYQPTVQEPLVFHLHGHDGHPESLVLSEDDHLEFLVAISQNTGRETDPIPRRVRQAMADSSLLLLGYALREWDFRTLFWGLIKPRPRQPMGVAIQLTPSDMEKRYLESYLALAELRVYWGNIREYVRDLYKVWQE